MKNKEFKKDKKNIWMIGGTKDARIILEKILEKTDLENKFIKIIVSTATDYGKKLLENFSENKKVKMISKKLEKSEMEKLILEKDVDVVIDASHPYAVNVSKNIISIVKNLKENNVKNIRYFRFERKMLDYGNNDVFKFENVSEIIEFLNRFENKNILSTLGSNNLEEIIKINKKNNVVIRILPTTSSIEKAEKLGFLPKNIVAVQGPFNKEFNKVILKNFKIDFLITKESGKTGGEFEKIEACRECDVKILVLKRPFVDYENIFFDIDEILNCI